MYCVDRDQRVTATLNRHLITIKESQIASHFVVEEIHVQVLAGCSALCQVQVCLHNCNCRPKKVKLGLQLQLYKPAPDVMRYSPPALVHLFLPRKSD